MCGLIVLLLFLEVGPSIQEACDSQPCQNGGTCHTTADGYNCTCPGNVTGTNCHCDENRDCSADLGQGMCNPFFKDDEPVNPEDNSLCLCRNGFTGHECKIEINQCYHVIVNKSPTEGNTICANLPYSPPCADRKYRFACDYCAVNVCENNATCVLEEFERSFNCVCPLHFDGERCEIVLCSRSQNCSGKGSCNPDYSYESPDSYPLCVCDRHYDGKSCEKQLFPGTAHSSAVVVFSSPTPSSACCPSSSALPSLAVVSSFRNSPFSAAGPSTAAAPPRANSSVTVGSLSATSFISSSFYSTFASSALMLSVLASHPPTSSGVPSSATHVVEPSPSDTRLTSSSSKTVTSTGVARPRTTVSPTSVDVSTPQALASVDDDAGMIVGIVIGCVVAIGLVIIAIIIFVVRARSMGGSYSPSRQEAKRRALHRVELASSDMPPEQEHLI